MTGSSPKLSLRAILMGPGALGTTSKRFGSCCSVACLFMREMPSTIVIRLGSPLVSVERVGEGVAEVDTVRLCPDAEVDDGPAFGVDGSTLSDAVRLRGGELGPAFAAAVAGFIRGGALAALAIDCLDREELREREVSPSATRTAFTAGLFFNLPAPEGPATGEPFGSLTEPPKPSTVDRFEPPFCLFAFARDLLIDSVIVSLAYPFSVSSTIRVAGRVWTELRFVVRFFSLASPPIPGALIEVGRRGLDGPAYVCSTSSSELSSSFPRRADERFLSMRVCQRLDGDPLEESSAPLRELPMWNRPARLPNTPRFFEGDSPRNEDDEGMFVSLGELLPARKENETCREGGTAGTGFGCCFAFVFAFPAPLLKRGFSCTSTGPSSSSSALLPPVSSMMVVLTAPFGSANSEIECAGGIWIVYGFAEGGTGGGEEARHVGSVSEPGGDTPICEADCEGAMDDTSDGALS